MSHKVTLSAMISVAQGVIGPLLDRAEVSYDRAVADGELRMLTSRVHMPFTSVYRCSKNTPKTAICATSGGVRRAFEAGRLARQGIAAS
jgi:hypothetical protein